MLRHRPSQVLLALFVLLACPVLADAQQPAPGPGPMTLPPPKMMDPPMLPPGYEPGLGDPRPFLASTYVPGSAGPYGVTADSPSSQLAPELVELGRPGTSAGWYAGVTLGIVDPHLSTHLSPVSPFGSAFPAPNSLPFASLNWTVSPRFELGYRFPDACADLRIGYHFIAATGSETRFGDDLRSRLDVNAIDLDFVSSEWLLWAPPELFRDLRLVFGVRIATAYFDSSAQGARSLDARFSSQFVGAGPRVGLEWRRAIGPTPLELFTRVETTGLLGGTRQDYTASVQDAAGHVLGAAQRVGPQSNGVAVLGVEAGLAWRPSPNGRWRFATGYQFEEWWNLGRTDIANADLLIQGVFLRAEWRY